MAKRWRRNVHRGLPLRRRGPGRRRGGDWAEVLRWLFARQSPEDSGGIYLAPF